MDVETTFFNKGNPFNVSNFLVVIGTKELHNSPLLFWEDFKNAQNIIDNSSYLVTFNGKFDLHWLRKAGIDISNVKIWDCQIAEFLLENQKNPYPALDQAAEKYGLKKKLDIVKTQYWEKGVNTNEIPRPILGEYLEQDLSLTEQVYLKQIEQFKNDKRFPLFKLQCADLLALEEMEWNGLVFNTEKALNKAKEIENELSCITEILSKKVGGVPFNPDSNDDLSCALYGGEIVHKIRVPVGRYKTGDRVGQVRYKIMEKVYTLPRLVEPIKGTEVKKSTEERPLWEVNEAVLRKLKPGKEGKDFISAIKEYNKLVKLHGTYLVGYSKLIEKMNWEPNMLHGNLNQCVAITGRLSSSSPNMQNADPITKVFMESRYDM